MVAKKEEVKDLNELFKEKAINTLKSLQVIFGVIGIILYGGGLYAVSQFRIDNTEKRLTKIEEWKENYINTQNKQYIEIINKLSEIKTELEVIKKQQLLYHQ